MEDLRVIALILRVIALILESIILFAGAGVLIRCSLANDEGWTPLLIVSVGMGVNLVLMMINIPLLVSHVLGG